MIMLYEHHFRAMNTGVGVWVWSADLEHTPTIQPALGWAEAFFGRAEAELSRFRGHSALSRLNRAAGRGPHVVSSMLWAVLLAAFDAAHFEGTPSFLVGKTGGRLSVLSWSDLTPDQFTGPIDRLLGT
jgi:hypothetical protein